ncbi:hypothetical protein TSOC_004429 [Tetrabaena socialis]|uniref:Uncharacterized protein n=1 Tax=Tetrabaena socialis TaxID=47790 RepID=A0A2J8A921_9CHLO|nr:hypothetical protein TSOC_004429 [Tetrabaena socialis]|eukprot:PNH08973.1 hypothetical protein TSOC_004429 [Tetrabaena socialis]
MAKNPENPVIQFVVCDGPSEVHFKTNSHTPIKKVWASYIASRKWTAAEANTRRLFKDEATGVSLGGTIASNNVKPGSRLAVYELDADEQCQVCLTDQHGARSTFPAWIEDDVSYWVDEFRTAAWNGTTDTPSGTVTRPENRLLEQYVLYDCVSLRKVDTSPAAGETLDAYVSDAFDAFDPSGSLPSLAQFVCFRYLLRPSVRRIKVTFWMWNGDSTSIEAPSDAPLAELVAAVTAIYFPARPGQPPPRPDAAVLFKRRLIRCANPSGAGADDTQFLIEQLRVRDLIDLRSGEEMAEDDPGSVLMGAAAVREWRRGWLRPGQDVLGLCLG